MPRLSAKCTILISVTTGCYFLIHILIPTSPADNLLLPHQRAAIVESLLPTQISPSPPNPPTIHISPTPSPSPYPQPSPAHGTPLPFSKPPLSCSIVTQHAPLPTELCYGTEGCIGELRIWHTVCPPFPKEVAREGGLETEIHALGPDAFRVRWEGPEVVMVAMHHVGGCRYEGSFAFSLSGEYELQAFTMFANFHGHADHPYARPSYVPNVLVKPDTQRVRCVKPLHPWRAPTTLPRCADLQAPGRWVRTPGSGAANPGRAISGWPTKWLKAGVVFARHWGADMQWQPHSCHFSDYSQDDLVDALAGMKIAFIGDSQTRSMFYPVVNAIHQNKVLGNPKIVDQNPHHQGWIEFVVRGNITLRYYVDNFLSNSKSANSLTWHSLIRSSTHDWDLLIVGMGNWAMCGNLAQQGIGLWSFHRYRREIDRISGQLQAFIQRTGTRVIWHNQPDFPWEMDPYRNGARLRLFNRYATDRMVSGGIEVFDAFNVSTGMLHTAVGWPLGHFNDFHVRENWARILLSYLVDHPRRQHSNPVSGEHRFHA